MRPWCDGRRRRGPRGRHPFSPSQSASFPQVLADRLRTKRRRSPDEGETVSADGGPSPPCGLDDRDRTGTGKDELAVQLHPEQRPALDALVDGLERRSSSRSLSAAVWNASTTRCSASLRFLSPVVRSAIVLVLRKSIVNGVNVHCAAQGLDRRHPEAGRRADIWTPAAPFQRVFPGFEYQ
jgi:hypothetical protein